MCAADQGLAMNGQIVSECAILQLPIVILDKMPFAWAYLT
jgi:lipid A disaccharide synthetase